MANCASSTTIHFGIIFAFVFDFNFSPSKINRNFHRSGTWPHYLHKARLECPKLHNFPLIIARAPNDDEILFTLSVKSGLNQLKFINSLWLHARKIPFSFVQIARQSRWIFFFGESFRALQHPAEISNFFFLFSPINFLWKNSPTRSRNFSDVTWTFRALFTNSTFDLFQCSSSETSATSFIV